MHFSKTYTELLESLPPELRKNTVQYRQLKKIINQVVKELSSLGLSPDLLQNLLDAREKPYTTHLDTQNGDSVSPPPPFDGRVTESQPSSLNSANVSPKIIYELNETSSRIEPRLRISLDFLEELSDLLHLKAGESDAGTEVQEQDEGDVRLHGDESETTDESGELNMPAPRGDSLFRKLQHIDLEKEQVTMEGESHSNNHEVTIRLVSDSQFFELLCSTLEHMSAHLKSIEAEFTATLTTLAETIRDSARPTSSSHSILGRDFRAFSPLRDNAGTINVQHTQLSQSDLYSWREIFQIYAETEVFESMHEQDRGERTVEECERRMQLFATQVTQRGLLSPGKFKLKKSRPALETFLQLNIFILNVKKFQLANSEATRKILKKHAKRTALPLLHDSSSNHPPPRLALIPQSSSSSLPRILVQAIGETLLPILPHLDDYSCLICTSIAFKPIRLDCGHLFCVRCLVKMQKRGNDNCPMCRSPCVLSANRSNVDWALINFIQDWFPVEAREKLKANEKEATAEELEERGIDPSAPCIIM